MNRFLAVVMLLLCTTMLRAEDWPCWRGPRLDGSSLEKSLPLKWSVAKAGKDKKQDMENIAWRTAIAGIGHSSPIVHGDRIFVTSCLIKEDASKEEKLKEHKRSLLCLDRRDGKILWTREVFESLLEPKHGLNSFSSSTPATDGKLVYVSFLRLRKKSDNDGPPSQPRETPRVPGTLIPEIVVAAYDFAGEKVWETVPGRFYSVHGFCSCPILHNDKVIVNADQDAEAYIVALDRSTGKEIWRINRPNRMRSYCVPLILTAEGKTQMVVAGNLGVSSFDPDTSKLLWSIKGPTEQYVASLVYGDGLLFLTAGFPEKHNMTIRPDGSGDVTKTHVVWHEKVNAQKAAYVPSPLFADKHFYVVSDPGYLSCFDSQSGKRTFFEQMGRHHTASPIFADGHVYLTDDDGITYVLKSTGKFDVVSRNPLSDPCYTSPAVSQGQIFIRTLHYLYCIGNK